MRERRPADRLRCCVIVLVLAACAGASSADPGHVLVFGFGQTPERSLLDAWDIAIGPDGAELPAGRGDVARGRQVYAEKCAACHGVTGREGPDPVLVGGQGTLDTTHPLLTIGSYWSHATTLYDYINRAMPFFAPGSLHTDEVYALCAFLLHANQLIAADEVMDRTTLPQVRMPNRDGFIADSRPDTGAIESAPEHSASEEHQ